MKLEQFHFKNYLSFHLFSTYILNILKLFKGGLRPQSIVHGGPFVMPPAKVLIPNWGPGRTTPFDDRHIKAKIEEVEQTKAEKGHISSMVEDAEIIMKAVGLKMSKDLSDDQWPLQQVVRVGAFPMGTMLKGEKDIEMVVMTKEKAWL